MMSHGLGQPCWGIRRLDLEELPVQPHEPGTRIPFVSTFEYGDRPGRWDGFNAYPISYGTGDEGQIDACVAKLGAEELTAWPAASRADWFRMEVTASLWSTNGSTCLKQSLASSPAPIILVRAEPQSMECRRQELNLHGVVNPNTVRLTQVIASCNLGCV